MKQMKFIGTKATELAKRYEASCRMEALLEHLKNTHRFYNYAVGTVYGCQSPRYWSEADVAPAEKALRAALIYAQAQEIIVNELLGFELASFTDSTLGIPTPIIRGTSIDLKQLHLEIQKEKGEIDTTLLRSVESYNNSLEKIKTDFLKPTPDDTKIEIIQKPLEAFITHIESLKQSGEALVTLHNKLFRTANFLQILLSSNETSEHKKRAIEGYKFLAKDYDVQGAPSLALKILGGLMLTLGVAIAIYLPICLACTPLFLVGSGVAASSLIFFAAGQQKGLSRIMDDLANSAQELVAQQHAAMP